MGDRGALYPRAGPAGGVARHGPETAVRRQPAKRGSGPLAGHRSDVADLRRANARHRHRGNAKIVRCINQLREDGLVLIVISSKLDEVGAYTSRIVGMRHREMWRSGRTFSLAKPKLHRLMIDALQNRFLRSFCSMVELSIAVALSARLDNSGRPSPKRTATCQYRLSRQETCLTRPYSGVPAHPKNRRIGRASWG